MISGWAPVTNLYETVIWVALIAATIGLVLEAVYRRVYPAAAAAGVAMFCTIIAANAQSVLNPNIEALNPILRSNYWLTIHVITIVSSYAAFSLALGLGLIGTWFYLTAPYRRDVGINELARPLLAVPVLAGLGPGDLRLGIYGSVQRRSASGIDRTGYRLWGLGVTTAASSSSAARPGLASAGRRPRDGRQRPGEFGPTDAEAGSGSTGAVGTRRWQPSWPPPIERPPRWAAAGGGRPRSPARASPRSGPGSPRAGEAAVTLPESGRCSTGREDQADRQFHLPIDAGGRPARRRRDDPRRLLGRRTPGADSGDGTRRKSGR